MRMRAYVAISLALFTLAAAGYVFADHAVNINTASVAELDTLPSIGEARAQDIVEYREANGPFATIEDIMNVSGIGTGTYNSVKDHITVGSAESETPSENATSTSTESTATTTPSSTETAAVSGGGGESTYVSPPVPLMFAEAGDDRTVMVGADTEFHGYAYNRDREVLEGLVRFHWNFGDGTTAEGDALLHHFEYPGTYAVVLTIAQNRLATSDRIKVTAEPARLGFWTNGDGSISIRNDSGHDLNLSGWLVRSFDYTFALPEDTYVLTGATLRIPQKTMRFSATSAEAELLYPNGALAFNAGDGAVTPAASGAAAPISEPAAAKPRQSASPVSPEPLPETIAHERPAISLSVAAAAASLPEGNPWTFGNLYWWLGAFALALTTVAAIVAARRLQRDEWDIIEES